MNRRALLALLPWAAAWGQLPTPGFPPPGEKPKRLPDGRLQNEAILKDDYERNQRELEQMADLLKSVEEAVRKAGPGRASRDVLKDLEEVEKLSRRIHSRMRRF
jgi:hypothetical protein